MEFDFPQNMYAGQNGANPLSVDPNHVNGYSSTPDGDPIQSPFVHNFNHCSNFDTCNSNTTLVALCSHPLPTPDRRSKDQISTMGRRTPSQSSGLGFPK